MCPCPLRLAFFCIVPYLLECLHVVYVRVCRNGRFAVHPRRHACRTSHDDNNTSGDLRVPRLCQSSTDTHQKAEAFCEAVHATRNSLDSEVHHSRHYDVDTDEREIEMMLGDW